MLLLLIGIGREIRGIQRFLEAMLSLMGAISGGLGSF